MLRRLQLSLPRTIQTFTQRVWPALCLPSRVIFKGLKPGWDKDFEHEQQMYARLDAVQGSLVPVFYGKVQIGDSCALLLSEVPGVLSCKQTAPRLTVDEFRFRAHAAFRRLGAFGLVHEDASLENVFLVDEGKRLMFVDLKGCLKRIHGNFLPKATRIILSTYTRGT